jgi:hypothetical protein
MLGHWRYSAQPNPITASSAAPAELAQPIHQRGRVDAGRSTLTLGSSMKFLRILRFAGLVTLAIALLWFVTCLSIYRIPAESAPKSFEGNVHYKFLELGLDNRSFFESLLGNVPARLVDGTELYVSKSEKKLLWPESPWEMEKKHYTYRTRVTAQPLKFGGLGPAQVIEVKRVEEAPWLSK